MLHYHGTKTKSPEGVLCAVTLFQGAGGRQLGKPTSPKFQEVEEVSAERRSSLEEDIERPTAVPLAVLEWLEAVGGIALVRVALQPCSEHRWYEERGLRW